MSNLASRNLLRALNEGLVDEASEAREKALGFRDKGKVEEAAQEETVGLTLARLGRACDRAANALEEQDLRGIEKFQRREGDVEYRPKGRS